MAMHESPLKSYNHTNSNTKLYIGLGTGAVIMVIIMVAMTAGSSAKQKRLSELKVEAEKYLYEIELKQSQYAGRQTSHTPVQVELETKLRGIEEEIREIDPRSKILAKLVERRISAEVRRTTGELLKLGASINRDESNHVVAVKLTFQNNGRSSLFGSYSLIDDYRNPTDEDLKLLISFPTVEDIDLSGTSITDAGLFHLKGLTNLKHLNLSNMKITDAGMRNLNELVNLETLDVTNTAVTPAAAEELRRFLPSCTVNMSQQSQ